MSAHKGGDVARTSSRNGHFAGERFGEILGAAEKLSAEDQGRQLLLLPGWDHYYNGHDEEAGKLMGRWMASPLNLAPEDATRSPRV